LLALLTEVPNYSRVPPELGTQVGWLCFAALVGLLVWLATRMESVRRSLLALEDPRMFAVMRIGMALMTIQCFWNLRPYWRMLWSDEGMFTIEDARSRMGGSSLTGWTPEDGFLDGWAFLKFLWGKHSAFFLDAAPDHVETYMFVFFGVLLLYAAGVLSRVTGLIAWLMMSSVYNHNTLYMEGTDTVYRSFWFILLFARTGAAWSVDNLVRCWWLRRRGRLQEVGLPPSPGRKPVYALVPSWPRYLMMGQLIAIYTSTGMVKTGSVWGDGDALYYALNLDHFYRFELWTQIVSASLGTTVFRLMTWVTLWWECCFAALGLGMILKFGHDHRDQPWHRAQGVAWRRWLGRLALLACYLLVYRITVLAYPYCVEIPKEATAAAITKLVDGGLWKLHVTFAGVLPALTVLWYVLGRWPLRLRLPARILARLPARIQPGPCTIDQVSMRRWLLGRRVWLSLGLFFHGFLILFMNIGMFPFIMLMTYAAWLTGEEYAAALRWLTDRLRRSPLGRRLPAAWFERAEQWSGPAQAPEDVPPRGRSVPDALVVLLGLGLVWLIYKRASGERELTTLVYSWFGLCLAVGLMFRLWRARPQRGAPALAYGPVLRPVALAFVLAHGLSVGLSLAPNYNIFGNWRSPTRALFGGWLSVTGTAQSWKMFAPNPPRANIFMKTVVVTPTGERWNIGNNAFDYRPFPWIWNDRARKMHRRMVSKGKWYLRYWSNFHCREWYLETGERAAAVEVHKITTRIPTPEQVATRGYYDPTKLKVSDELVETHTCALAGDLPPFMKLRRGMPLTAEEEATLAAEQQREAKTAESRRKSWANRRDWGGTGPVTDPTPLPAAARPQADDEPPAKDGGDGE
jgi:hypothetical protein